MKRSACCMCEPMETAQTHGDDTHAVVARPKWAREHGLHRVWSFVSVGCEPGHIDRCSDKDVGENERKTPFPLRGNRQAEIRSKDKDRTTHDKKCSVDRTGQDRTRLRDNLSAHIISHPSSAGVHSCFQSSLTDMCAGQAGPGRGSRAARAAMAGQWPFWFKSIGIDESLFFLLNIAWFRNSVV